MNSGLPQGPQKFMIIISSIGFIFTDYSLFISALLYFVWGGRYDSFVMALILIVFLSLQIIVSIVYMIIGFTCWKGQFLEKMFKSYLNRFFYYSDLIITHIPIIVVGMMFLTLPDYEPKLKTLKYVILSFSILESVFFIILIISLIISCINQSDKETFDNSEIEDTNQSFFQNPQKTIMQISLITLFSFTFIELIISIVMFLGDHKKAFSIEMINAFLSGIVLVFLLVLLIISQTCWKGTFLIKLVENKIRRLIGFLLGFLFYIGYITFEIIQFVFAQTHQSGKSRPLYTFEISIALICPLVQFISMIVFTVGFCIAHRSKKKYDLHSSSLINNINENMDK